MLLEKTKFAVPDGNREAFDYLSIETKLQKLILLDKKRQCIDVFSLLFLIGYAFVGVALVIGLFCFVGNYRYSDWIPVICILITLSVAYVVLPALMILFFLKKN